MVPLHPCTRQHDSPFSTDQTALRTQCLEQHLQAQQRAREAKIVLTTHHVMQSLLLQRATGSTTPSEFAQALVETFYYTLTPKSVFAPSRGAVNSLSVDAEHRYLLSGCADSSLKLWDVNAEKPECLATVPRRTAHTFGVSSVKWWPFDSGLFLSASFDHTVNVWDTNKMGVVHTFDVENRVYAISVLLFQENQYSAQALVAAASDQPAIRLLDLRLAASAHTLPGHQGKTLAVAWHPTNAYFLASGGHDGEAKLWDIRRSSSCLCRLDMTHTHQGASSHSKAHLGPVNAVVWDDYGYTLYTAGNDDKVRVWDVAGLEPVNKLVNFGPLTRNKYLQALPLVLSPHRETEVQCLLFASDSGDILVFRASDGKLLKRLLRSSTSRTSALVYARPRLACYYSGTMDGEIVEWVPGDA